MICEQEPPTWLADNLLNEMHFTKSLRINKIDCTFTLHESNQTDLYIDSLWPKINLWPQDESPPSWPASKDMEWCHRTPILRNHAGWGDWMRSGKFAWMRFETHFCRLIECLLLFYFNPLVISEIDLNLLNLAENEGEKSNPPLTNWLIFWRSTRWGLGHEVASENDRSLASFGPLRPRKLSRRVATNCIFG